MLTLNPSTGDAPLTKEDAPLIVNLDASDSKDEGDIVKYKWSVICPDDHTEICPAVQKGTDEQATVAFEICGTYEITLSVTDDMGVTSETTQETIEVNCLPVAAFTHHVLFSNLPLIVEMNAGDSEDNDGNITKYEWLVEDDQHQVQELSGQATTVNVDEGLHTITLTITDDNGATNTIQKKVEISGPYNNTARIDPQIIAAGVTPTKLDQEDNQFDIVALVRPGREPIKSVSVKSTAEGHLRLEMTLAGVLPNGDEIYKATYSYEAGSIEGTLSTVWGPKQGQYNIIALDQYSNLSHTYPYLMIGNFPEQAAATKQAASISYDNKARQAPQVIMAGYSPAKLHVGDNQFDVIAIVRRGKLPIRNVILKQNDELFRQTMRFIGELENGDEVYKLTYTYKRGYLGTPPAGGVVEHKALWGPDAHQFGIEVIDESGVASHKFPDIEFGYYPELKPE